MTTATVTTPFGRRPTTLALVKRQMDVAENRSARAIDKWKVFRDVAEARGILGLQDRALAVLDALLSFYPDNELSDENGLIVFPSNAQLSLRAHGIAGTTLRRHLAALIEAGLLNRHDSPNGKRYAHRSRGGEIEKAYGFSLAPLLARASELAHMAQQVAEERRLFRRAKEALTICRRDVRKLISAAMEEGADGDWRAVEAHYLALISGIPRSPNRQNLENGLSEMQVFREEVVNLLENQLKTQESDGNDVQNGCHIQNSKPESINELEPGSEQEQGGNAQPKQQTMRKPLKSFPLGMVLKACPQISDYGPGGQITQWRDLMSAAVVVRSALGVSPSAYQEACEIMGPENAATTMACLLERGGQISSAGGYLRELTRKAMRGEFSLGPMIMALIRTNAGDVREVS